MDISFKIKNKIISKYEQLKPNSHEYIQSMLVSLAELKATTNDFQNVCSRTNSKYYAHYVLNGMQFDFTPFFIDFSQTKIIWHVLPCFQCSHFDFNHNQCLVFHLCLRIKGLGPIKPFFTLNPQPIYFCFWEFQWLWHQFYSNQTKCLVSWLPEELFESCLKTLFQFLKK
jgi:hypothetical protein